MAFAKFNVYDALYYDHSERHPVPQHGILYSIKLISLNPQNYASSFLKSKFTILSNSNIMKWTYSIQNKSVASVALFSLCLLVLFSNYIDRDHTQNVKNAISTLYEDRLIAEGYILKMTSIVYQIKETLNSDTEDAAKNNSINNQLLYFKELNDAYQKTKFTVDEKVKADKLLTSLRELEATNTQNKLLTANEMIVLLSELSAIQLEESMHIMEHAETLYLSGKTSSEFVFAIIIIILVVLQALVFASKTLVPNDKSKFPNLN
jgi:hypothetical protein